MMVAAVFLPGRTGRVSARLNSMPVPLSEAVRVPPEVVAVSTPFRGPLAAGLKVTLMGQLPPLGTVPQP